MERQVVKIKVEINYMFFIVVASAIFSSIMSQKRFTFSEVNSLILFTNTRCVPFFSMGYAWLHVNNRVVPIGSPDDKMWNWFFNGDANEVIGEFYLHWYVGNEPLETPKVICRDLADMNEVKKTIREVRRIRDEMTRQYKRDHPSSDLCCNLILFVILIGLLYYLYVMLVIKK